MLKVIIPALAALSLAAPLQAEGFDTNSGTVAVSVTVPFEDLDLTSEAGAATLNARIAAAVKKVCGAPESGLELHFSSRDCRKQALGGAMEQLAALHIDTPLMALSQ